MDMTELVHSSGFAGDWMAERGCAVIGSARQAPAQLQSAANSHARRTSWQANAREYERLPGKPERGAIARGRAIRRVPVAPKPAARYVFDICRLPVRSTGWDQENHAIAESHSHITLSREKAIVKEKRR